MKPQNLLGYFLKIVTLFAVLGVLALGLGIFVYSLYEIFYVVKSIGFNLSDGSEILLKALKSIDLVLISVAFFIIATGLFELFIAPIDNLPEWLNIKDIDELKGLLIKVLVVVVGVSFTGRVVTWDGETDLLSYGITIGIIIFALSYFLRVKAYKQEQE